MTAINDIPITSVTWLLGSISVLAVSIRSFLVYRHSRTELLGYSAWFGMVIGISLLFFSVPSLFTLNTAVLLKWDLVGEILYYSSMVIQAAMVWFLILRKYVPLYVVTVPVALLALSSWIYAIPRARVAPDNGLYIYQDPRFSTFVLGGLLIGLFLPVGLYFLRMAPRQHGIKSTMNSLIFGLTYVGIGLTTGITEIVTGKVINRNAAPGIMAFFVALLVIALWPRQAAPRVDMKTPPSY